jgi:CheY-like chemotaxis protein
MSRDPAPANLALLLGVAERLTAQGDDREALAELQREIEKIQGAAGSSGFLDASRLAAGMEATVEDWATRPDDGDVDRGSVTLWFVTRLAAMLKLEMPRRAAAPRPKPTGAPAPRRTAGIPTPPSAPVAPGPPKVLAPPAAPPRRLIIRRPSAVRPSPEPPAPVPDSASVPAPPPAPPPSGVEAPPPEPPPDALTQELTWLIPPDEAFPADLADAVAPAATPEPLAESTPPTPPEAQLSLRFPPLSAPAADAATPVEPPAPEAPPAATPPTPEPQPIAESSAEPQPIEVAATVAEVIFVEDDAALAELLAYGLQSRGYRFLSYRNGREALRELVTLDVQGTRPLLLLDVDLPGLDGYSVFDALQRERPGTYRVVFTTVHGTEEEQLRGLEAGALDYMVKPISLRVALEKIKRWVGR